jgi:hypothetical protein
MRLPSNSMAVPSNGGAVGESPRPSFPWPTSYLGALCLGVALRRVDTIVQWIRRPTRCLILGRKHHERFSGGDTMKYDAWLAKAARQRMVLEFASRHGVRAAKRALPDERHR